MNEHASYRQIFRSTSIVGGATIGSIVIGMARVKVFALLVGPTGIGLFGLLTAVLTTASAFAGMGISSSAVRQIAPRVGGGEEGRVRCSFWTLTALLTALGVSLTWLFRFPIAVLAGNADFASDIGWLAWGVGFSIFGYSQLAEFQAYQRIKALAYVRLLGALTGSFLGIAAVYMFRDAGVAAAVITMPFAGVIIGLAYQRQLPRLRPPRFRMLAFEWPTLLRLGLVLMVSGLMSSAAQIFIRSIILRNSGLETTGLYQAAYSISATNLGLVLNSMAADYFPRLSKMENDRRASQLLVNQQLRVGLLIGGPLLLAMIAAAPLILQILYRSDFTGASRLLQWHLFGDIFKIAGWVLGFVLVARNDTRYYLLVEVVFIFTYMSVFTLLYPKTGLESAGIAYFLSYILYVVIAASICVRRHGITISKQNTVYILYVVVLAAGLIGAASISARVALFVGALITLILSIYAVGHLRALMTPVQEHAQEKMPTLAPPERSGQ